MEFVSVSYLCLEVYTNYGISLAYLDFQELAGHYKHTKHQGNQKNEDPNDTYV